MGMPQEFLTVNAADIIVFFPFVSIFLNHKITTADCSLSGFVLVFSLVIFYENSNVTACIKCFIPSCSKILYPIESLTLKIMDKDS